MLNSSACLSGNPLRSALHLGPCQFVSWLGLKKKSNAEMMGVKEGKADREENSLTSLFVDRKRDDKVELTE